MANFPKIAEIWYKLTVFKDISQVVQNSIKRNGALRANLSSHKEEFFFLWGLAGS